MTCHGNHVTFFQHCCVAAPFTCGAACGQALKCGNHTCAAECHPLNVSYPSNIKYARILRLLASHLVCTDIDTMIGVRL